MASLSRKQNGIWYILYRENGKQQVRSLRTNDRREALQLKRGIELNLGAGRPVFLKVTERPPEATKNPELDKFWIEFSEWAVENRTPSTIEEYENWFTQISEFTGAKRLGDITSHDIQAFRSAISSQGKSKPQGVGVYQRVPLLDLTITKALGAALVCLALLRALRHRTWRLPKTGLAAPAILFGAVCALSLIWSRDRTVSLDLLIIYVTYLMIFFAIVWAAREPETARRLFRLFALSSAALGLLTIACYFGFAKPTWWYTPSGRSNR